MKGRKINISVRSLVEFICRSGDIDNMSGTEPPASEAMLEGGRIHRKIQKEAGPSYQAEVPLKYTARFDDGLEITVSGRADGIISGTEIGTDEDGALSMHESITIDEIKGTYRKLRHITEPVPVHLAQAKCYACFYILSMMEKDENIRDDLARGSGGTFHDKRPDSEHLDDPGTASGGRKIPAGIDMYVQLTYAGMKNGEIKRFKEKQDIGSLLGWYDDLISTYYIWVKRQILWEEQRDNSIRDLHFPYDYRKGQKKMISGVYQTIVRGKRLFAMAPTGTGKTLAALYPAIQAVGAGSAEKIFYLTAKNITGTVADDTIQLLRGDSGAGSGNRSDGKPAVDTGNHLMIKSVFLTARDKICIFDTAQCSPKLCPRAGGHYDRVNKALYELIENEDRLDRGCIEEYAQRFNVCPYALALDAAGWSDIIICDYNYVFDPDVALKQFFSNGKGEYIFLIDEAHNLVSRARSMYSASLSLTEMNAAARDLKGIDRTLGRRISTCRTIIRNMRDSAMDNGDEDPGHDPAIILGEGTCRLWKDRGNLMSALSSLREAMEETLKQEIDIEKRERLAEFYFTVRKFMSALERSTDKYIKYSVAKGKQFELYICCADPSDDLGSRLSKGKAAIFFSATMLPVNYYKEMLSDTSGEDYDLYIDSPFDRSRRLLFMAGDVSSAYRRRGPEEYKAIASYIYGIIRAKYGNYMIFFPSYAMMDDVYNVFSELYMQTAGHGIEIIRQKRDMSDEDRQRFLDAFSEDEGSAVTGMCVMGGVFAEGIDLKADRLIGVIIVGTGLPQICAEREYLKAYFDRRGMDGFAYAYLYPGMNKVQQAAGRVIRTQSDEGVIALLDERFAYRQYRELFPREWSDCIRTDRQNAARLVEDFWTGRSAEK